MSSASDSPSTPSASPSGKAAAAQVERNAQRGLAVLCLILGGVALGMGQWTTVSIMAVVIAVLGVQLMSPST